MHLPVLAVVRSILLSAAIGGPGALLVAAEAAPPAADAAPSAAAGTDLPASQVSAESLTLDDGSVLTGVYDSDAQVLKLINATSGKAYGSMALSAQRILSRKDITIVPPAASTKPHAQPGTSGQWLDSLAVAKAAAKASGRPILMDFTGSDWCPWCKRLHAEVFATNEFKSWASAHVVLLELDFPHHTEQSSQLKSQNSELARSFQINGYPTVLLVAGNGVAVLGRSGYMAGGPKPWIADLEGQAHLH